MDKQRFAYWHQQLIAAVFQRSLELMQQHGRNQRPAKQKLQVAAAVHMCGLLLRSTQVAGYKADGDVRSLAASSGLSHSSLITSRRLRQLLNVHAWLVQHHLLDGQGLAGLLSEQQLAAYLGARRLHARPFPKKYPSGRVLHKFLASSFY
jgi:hypothetical protein